MSKQRCLIGAAAFAAVFGVGMSARAEVVIDSALVGDPENDGELPRAGAICTKAFVFLRNIAGNGVTERVSRHVVVT
ncbi:MAG: hypothetical protein WBE26_01205 [Phycisphaerae bacterium]